MSYSQSDDELAALLPVFYDKRLRELAADYEGFWNVIETDPLATRVGEVATFMQYAKIAPLAASTTLTRGVNPNPTDMVSGKITSQVYEKGAVVAIPSLERKTIIDGAEKVAQVVGIHGNESMEQYVAEVFGAQLSGIRVDADATYEKDSITDGAGAAGGTTMVDSALVEADDFWNGAGVVITDAYVGTFGEQKFVEDFTQSGAILEFDEDTQPPHTTSGAFSAQIASGTSYHISKPTAIAAGDVMTITAVRLAQKYLRNNGCLGPMWEIDGGGYNMVYDAITEEDLQNDLISAFQYKPNEAVIRKYPDRGMVAMCRPTLTTIPMRSAVTGAGTYSATGIVHYTPIFGKNCIAKLPLDQMDVKVIAKGETSGGTSNPLNRFSTTGWEYVGAFLGRNFAAGASVVSGHN
jgi:N4-gp56 family major capsid protein